MSSNPPNPSMIVNGLAEHARRAMGSSRDGAALPSSPVQSAGVSSAQPLATGICECCGKEPLHAGQQGARVLSEDDWYGLGEGTKLYRENAALEREKQDFINNLSEAAKERIEERGAAFESALPANLKRRLEKNRELIKAFEARRENLEFARRHKCQTLPQPPANLYRVVKPEQAKRLEAEWDAERANYQADGELPVSVKIVHRVPLVAGGCPTGADNLAAENRLSETCLEATGRLAQSQSDAAKRWREDGF